MYIRTAAVGNTKVGVDVCTSFLAADASGDEGHRQIARRRARVIVNQPWRRPSPFVIFFFCRKSFSRALQMTGANCSAERKMYIYINRVHAVFPGRPLQGRHYTAAS